MSVLITYKQVCTKKGYLEGASGEYILTSLVNAFGKLPRTFTEKDIPKLLGMVAVSRAKPETYFDDVEANPFQQLIDLICEYDKIEVHETETKNAKKA